MCGNWQTPELATSTIQLRFQVIFETDSCLASHDSRVPRVCKRFMFSDALLQLAKLKEGEIIIRSRRQPLTCLVEL